MFDIENEIHMRHWFNSLNLETYEKHPFKISPVLTTHKYRPTI
jgi:hypothetical protein